MEHYPRPETLRGKPLAFGPGHSISGEPELPVRLGGQVGGNLDEFALILLGRNIAHSRTVVAASHRNATKGVVAREVCRGGKTKEL